MKRGAKLGFLGVLFALCAVSAFVKNYDRHRHENARPVELFDVVYRQVTAFRHDDVPAAYRQVSTGFQEKFDLDAFTDLARSDYPALRIAERVEFGAVRWEGSHAIVPAYFFLKEGEVIPCLYRLVREGGSWKIDSVRVQRRWPAGKRLGGLRA